MVTAILIDDDQLKTEKGLKILSSISGIAQIFVASVSSAPNSLSKTTTWINSQSSLAASIKKISEIAATKQLMIVSSELIPSFESLTALTTDNQQRNGMIIASNSGCDLNPASLIKTISDDNFRISAISTARQIVSRTQSLLENSDLSSEEIIALLAVAGLAGGSPIIEIIEQSNSSSSRKISDKARAQILQIAIDSFNIEELFSELSWKTHSTESAALVYHSLTAIFIRFGDLAAANQCLALSENLEDSPRYFALKGFIAEKSGEALGAVAHMVSSLQCYENRKKNDGSHLLEFQPMNVEVINTELVQGLDALHKRDNHGAYGHFLQAVANFDSFYKQFGVNTR